MNRPCREARSTRDSDFMYLGKNKGEMAPKEKNNNKEKLKAMELNTEQLFCDMGESWKMLFLQTDQNSDTFARDGGSPSQLTDESVRPKIFDMQFHTRRAGEWQKLIYKDLLNKFTEGSIPSPPENEEKNQFPQIKVKRNDGKYAFTAIFYPTGKVMIQGCDFLTWGLDTFPLLKKAIDNISDSSASEADIDKGRKSDVAGENNSMIDVQDLTVAMEDGSARDPLLKDVVHENLAESAVIGCSGSTPVMEAAKANDNAPKDSVNKSELKAFEATVLRSLESLQSDCVQVLKDSVNKSELKAFESTVLRSLEIFESDCVQVLKSAHTKEVENLHQMIKIKDDDIGVRNKKVKDLEKRCNSATDEAANSRRIIERLKEDLIKIKNDKVEAELEYRQKLFQVEQDFKNDCEQSISQLREQLNIKHDEVLDLKNTIGSMQNAKGSYKEVLVQNTPIKFKGEQDEFSNFYHITGGLQAYGQTFYSQEEAFQYRVAMESEQWDKMKDILEAKNGPAAYTIGKDVKKSSAWESKEKRIMKELSYLKVEACPEFKDKLLSSGNRPIIENTLNKKWGIGADGNGMNLMGKILVEVREEIRKSLSGDSKSEVMVGVTSDSSNDDSARKRDEPQPSNIPRERFNFRGRGGGRYNFTGRQGYFGPGRGRGGFKAWNNRPPWDYQDGYY